MKFTCVLENKRTTTRRESLTILKCKYPCSFSAQGVFRAVGTDITAISSGDISFYLWSGALSADVILMASFVDHGIELAMVNNSKHCEWC